MSKIDELTVSVNAVVEPSINIVKNSPKIEIKTVGKDSPFTAIYVDGQKLTGVSRFELKQEVGNNMPILTIDLNALNLSTDVQVLKINQYGMGEISAIAFGEHSVYKNPLYENLGKSEE